MRNVIRRLSRLREDTGAEILELAIALPILLIIFAAIVDFGFVFQRYEVVTNAAREGARLAVLPGYSVSDVQGRVNDYLQASGLSAAPTPASVEYGTREVSPGGPVVRVVTVRVEYPTPMTMLNPIVGLIGAGSHGGVKLRALSIMRIEAGAGGS